MSAPNRQIPSLTSVTATLFGVTWKRLLRGRALWVCALIAALPTVIAVFLRDDRDVVEIMQFAQLRVIAILPPIFVASSIGDDIEDRTITYVWSRPVARWTLLVGKLATLAPVAAVLAMVGWAAATVAFGKPIDTQELAAIALGTLALSCIAAGIATLLPGRGMVMSIIYLVVVDPTIGNIPASIQDISVTRQLKLLAAFEGDGSIPTPLITLLAITAVWLAIGFRRIRRLEA